MDLADVVVKDTEGRDLRLGDVWRDKPAVLVRLFVQPVPNAIVALPLAALTAKHHLRLGL